MIGSKWNTPLINAVVLYVGSQAIQQIQHQQTQPSQETVAHNAFMDIFQVHYQSLPVWDRNRTSKWWCCIIDVFQALAAGLDSEGRYYFLNAIANQLRYPNIHTWYFMEVILYLFAESGQTAQGLHAKEQIARYVQFLDCTLSNHYSGLFLNVFSHVVHIHGVWRWPSFNYSSVTISGILTL